MLRCAFFGLSVLLVACSGGMRPAVSLAGGGYRLTCGGPLARCIERAEKLCRGQGGYWVASAFDSQKVVGHEMGQSQVEVRRSEATIYCGTAPAQERPPIQLKRAAPEPAATSSMASPARACVPGATQACVGKAGCAGGQACSTNGSHFEPCDCGGPPPAGSSTPPAAVP